MKRLLAFLFILTVFSFSSGQEIQQKVHRAKIFYNSSEDLERLESLGIPIDHGIKKQHVFIESDFSEVELAIAEANGFSTRITKADIKSFYRNQNNPTHRDFVLANVTRNATCTGDSGAPSYPTPTNFNVWPASNFGGFYTYSQVLQELADMASLYPNLITVALDIGPSGNPFITNGQTNNNTTPSIGNNTIKWVKISDNPNANNTGEPQVLYTSIHHAREPASLSQLLYFMWYLLENYDSDPEIQSIVDNTELFFVPVVNPDGYLHNEFTDPQGGGFWRKNRFNGHGVDNNRNYNYFINGNSSNGVWGGSGSSGNTGSDIYRGNAPFSEVENQAIKWFVEQNNFVIALNNHTFGELIYYPFGYNGSATPDDNVFVSITNEMVRFSGYNALRDGDFSGESDDFMYGTVGTHNSIFAMTPEIGNSFWPAQSSIDAICKDMMYTNLTAAQLAGNLGSLQENNGSFIASTTTQIEYTLKRIGLTSPSNFNVSINPISSNIQSVGNANSHNGLLFDEEVTDQISLTLDANIDVGDVVTYEIVWNNGLYDKSIEINKLFGTPTLLLDEVGNNTSTNWENTAWGTTTNEFVSASSSITDSPSGNYGPNENSAITLADPIDLSNALAANLSFYAQWEIENNWDYVQVEISTNNGSSWIPQCGKFTNTGVPNQSGANGEPLYDGTQSDWVLETIDLSDYLGASILIRFRLVSDVQVQGDGFYFDDLQVNILENNLSVEEVALNDFKIFPNPVTNQLFIKSQLDNYQFQLYTIQGQRILNFNNLSGDLELDLGKFANGIYLAHITQNGKKHTFKVIKE